MATNLNLVPFPATVVPGRRQRTDRRTAASSSTPCWWTPIFGWPAEPDYIDSPAPVDMTENGSEHDTGGTKVAAARSVKFAPGCFTEEKAKQLRMMTKETESFHDAMYHSAVASRLATVTDTKSRSCR